VFKVKSHPYLLEMEYTEEFRENGEKTWRGRGAEARKGYIL